MKPHEPTAYVATIQCGEWEAYICSLTGEINYRVSDLEFFPSKGAAQAAYDTDEIREEYPEDTCQRIVKRVYIKHGEYILKEE